MEKNLNSNLFYKHDKIMKRIIESNTHNFDDDFYLDHESSDKILDSYINDLQNYEPDNFYSNCASSNEILDSYINDLQNYEPIIDIICVPINTLVSYIIVKDNFELCFERDVTIQNFTNDSVVLTKNGVSWSVPISNTVFFKYSSISQLIDKTLSYSKQRDKFFSILFDYLPMVNVPVLTKNDLTVFDVVLNDFEVNNCSEYFVKIFYGNIDDFPNMEFSYYFPAVFTIRSGISKIQRINQKLYDVGNVTNIQIFDTSQNVVQVFPKQLNLF